MARATPYRLEASVRAANGLGRPVGIGKLADIGLKRGAKRRLGDEVRIDRPEFGVRRAHSRRRSVSIDGRSPFRIRDLFGSEQWNGVKDEVLGPPAKPSNRHLQERSGAAKFPGVRSFTASRFLNPAAVQSHLRLTWPP
jgi:hypothetical protein